MPELGMFTPDLREPAYAGRALLSVRGLSVTFSTDAGPVQAVDGVSFDIYPGETLALVGESGSGKSVTALSILRLIEAQRGRVREGSVVFEGRDMLSLSESEVRQIRGNRIAMIFQDPMSSLNPVYTVGDQIAEPLILHRRFSVEEARGEAIRLLGLVGMPAAERRVDEYPHRLSGGMRQRAMIAMALGCNPSLLIADEPTTALDVTVQAQILELLAELQARLGMSILMITHDLGVVAAVAHRALVMYAGRVVEQADVLNLFEHPRHPYSAGLLQSLPRLDPRGRTASARLRPIPGSVPDALKFPSGCRFHPRCAYALGQCPESVPLLRPPASSDESGASSATQPSADAPVAQASSEPGERLVACWHTEQHPDVDYLASEAGPPGVALDVADPSAGADRP
jgi:peptide/nickel transport system ATP-binding protein